MVAGGGRGIGANVAQLMAEIGHEVVVLDFPKPINFGIYESGSIAGTTFAALGVDLRDEDAVRNCAKEIYSNFGSIDTVTITAGAIRGGGSFFELEMEQLQDAVTKNIAPVHNCISSLLPYLTDSSWALPSTRSIVALTSVASIKALRGLAAYSAAKGGLRSYLQVAALELSDQQVRLNIVAPGSTRGAMLEASRDLYNLSSSDEFSIHHLSKRIIEVNEVASAVLLLHQNPAMVASEVVVDGGMTRT